MLARTEGRKGAGNGQLVSPEVVKGCCISAADRRKCDIGAILWLHDGCPRHALGPAKVRCRTGATHYWQQTWQKSEKTTHLPMMAKSIFTLGLIVCPAAKAFLKTRGTSYTAPAKPAARRITATFT